MATARQIAIALDLKNQMESATVLLQDINDWADRDMDMIMMVDPQVREAFQREIHRASAVT